MAFVQPVVLSRHGVRLEPLALEHEDGLRAAAADGQLWKLRVTSVPEPENTRAYIETALHMRQEGSRFAFAVIDETNGEVIGSTSYHDILVNVGRVEIGYTWYAQSRWRSAVNTTCKYLLLCHAFDTLGAETVGWRTDNLNFRSQQAIERLGAKKDGVIRGQQMRRDGTVRDTVMYSLIRAEWPPVKTALAARLGLAP